MTKHNQRGIVYILKCRIGIYCWHKIGYTRNLGNRFRDLDRKLDFSVVETIICDNARGLETHLHRQFRSKRKTGWQTSELFDLDEADIAYIQDLTVFENEPIRHYTDWIEAGIEL